MASDVSNAFRPLPMTVGGHRRRSSDTGTAFLRWTLPTRDIIVDTEVRLLLRASLHPDAFSKPTLLLVHGLGGSDRGTYSIATGLLAWSMGWNVVRMNMRGAGDSASLCPRLYNAGLDTDLVAALAATSEISRTSASSVSRSVRTSRYSRCRGARNASRPACWESSP